MAIMVYTKVTLKEISYSIENNNSLVSVVIEVVSNGTKNELGSTTGGDITYTCNGTTTSLGSLAGGKVYAKTTNLLYNNTITVPHASNGSGSVTVNVSKFMVAQSINRYCEPVSQSLELTPIPRGNSIYWNDIVWTVGSNTINAGLNVTKTTANYKTVVKWAIAGLSGYASGSTPSTAESFVWTIPRTVAAASKNQHEAGVFTVESYDSSNKLVCTRTQDFTIDFTRLVPVIPSNIFSLGYGEGPGGYYEYASTYGIHLTDYTNLNIQGTITTRLDATIVLARLTGDCGSYGIIVRTGNVINTEIDHIKGKVGNNTVTLTVTDSRGNTASSTYTFALESRTNPPVISTVVVDRGDGTGSSFVSNPVTGTTVKLSYSVTVPHGYCNVYYRIDGTEIKNESNVSGIHTVYLTSITPDQDTDIELNFVHALGAVNMTVVAPSGSPDINYNPDLPAIGIGTIATEEKTVVIGDDWTLVVKGQDRIVEQGYDTATGFWYRKWASGIGEVWGQKTETVNVATVRGAVYSTDGYRDMEIPLSLTDASATLNANNWCWCPVRSATGNTVSYYYFRPTTYSGSVTMQVNVKGLWQDFDETCSGKGSGEAVPNGNGVKY